MSLILLNYKCAIKKLMNDHVLNPIYINHTKISQKFSYNKTILFNPCSTINMAKLKPAQLTLSNLDLV